jgi:hypothetical protein
LSDVAERIPPAILNDSLDKIPLALIDKIIADAGPQTFFPKNGTLSVTVDPDEVRVFHDGELVHSEPRNDATPLVDGAPQTC